MSGNLTRSIVIVVFLMIFKLGCVQVKEYECGTTDYTLPLVAKGTQTNRGEWPFLTALYLVEGLKYHCGGTLISSKHVLTAAHCINNKYNSISLHPNDLIVVLGAYDLTSRSESGILNRNVSDIHVHPDWDAYYDKYDADLAILVLSENVTFTNYILPVCMPADNATVDSANGSVVGWGLTENERGPNLQFIKHAYITVLSDAYCYITDPGAALISSLRTFCGQGDNGNPNRGDSGGGVYIKFHSSWVQHGIISALRTNGYVHTESIVVYTNVKKFKSWITDKVTQSGGAVSEAKLRHEKKIYLNCDYLYGSVSENYGCFVDNLDIRSDNVAVASFTGFHRDGKTDHDVEFIQFRNGTMFFIPSGIGNIFNNLKELEVNDNLSTKFFSLSRFRNVKNLVYLKIQKNDIQTLSDECLRGLSNLQAFVLVNNNLKEISETAFGTNGKLEVVDLKSNDLEALPKNLFKYNLLLEKVGLNNNFLTTLDETIFELNAKLNEVWLHSNKLEVLPRNLFTNNLLLETVSFGQNSLTTFDETSFETNTKLRELYMDSNKLETLPRNLFSNNLLLEYIFLGENSLTTLDENMFKTNSKLRVVDLKSNKLEALPSNLFEYNLFLEKVDLNNNILKTLDETIFEVNAKLNQVWLYSNNLEVLPKRLFTNNLLLETVSVSRNFLTTLDETSFETNAKLREFYMDSNKLEVLPTKLFRNNLLLENIGFGRNSIKEIDATCFETNARLRKVQLHSNKLEVLPRNLFKYNLLLEKVGLNQNSLKFIQTDFTSFKHIKGIYLFYNACISAYYESDTPHLHLNQFRNLTKFQNLIWVNCSSPTP